MWNMNSYKLVSYYEVFFISQNKIKNNFKNHVDAEMFQLLT